MVRLMRTDSSHLDFRSLVALLDQDLAIRDGADHGFYAQFNQITNIQYCVVVYFDDQPVGCGAIKAFGEDSMEIKRMFVLPNYRGKSLAQQILIELEKWTLELGKTKTVLETGQKQPEAIALYYKSGYQRTPNYGQYIGIENSLCFEKQLS
ncbi:MAG: GNAT family N-acetyltransferase [Bacteroidetes bacterium 24-39-8]|nr:MAG: GNAT family N-acetyltransferase [Sphingobacteriia bacterium 35-40-5]OYZ51860.1 MAG: GNAT family N-acetyltransferase [Bacteroidetes bacterium 24-39-8]OZA63216.1 MAG: GNAT family N-acetyltransferase [Sphingobacteriia bacterium 39-39-8]HQR94329.1 GNAT family N-acetyltransferase [Sediminibacterium sp.]HQS55600.1 GNAT family N-acetyltransferase [Sediminibacterium sp.]